MFGLTTLPMLAMMIGLPLAMFFIRRTPVVILAFLVLLAVGYTQ